VVIGDLGPEPGSGGHMGRTEAFESLFGETGGGNGSSKRQGPEGSGVVVGGQCLGGETSLRAPSLIVDHNIPGIWSHPRAHIMSRADISGVNRSPHNRRGHFRLS
jgi:hypothetical protein